MSWLSLVVTVAVASGVDVANARRGFFGAAGNIDPKRNGEQEYWSWTVIWAILGTGLGMLAIVVVVLYACRVYSDKKERKRDLIRFGSASIQRQPPRIQQQEA